VTTPGEFGESDSPIPGKTGGVTSANRRQRPDGVAAKQERKFAESSANLGSREGAEPSANHPGQFKQDNVLQSNLVRGDSQIRGVVPTGKRPGGVYPTQKRGGLWPEIGGNLGTGPSEFGRQMCPIRKGVRRWRN